MTASENPAAKSGSRATASRSLLLAFLWAAGADTAAQTEPAQESGHSPSGQEDPAPATEDPRARLSTLFEGHLLDTQNGQDFVETQGYRRLLEMLYSNPPQETHSRIEGDLSFEGAMKDPDAWRGRFVRVRGLLGGYEAVRLRDTIGRSIDVYRGAVTTRWPGQGREYDVSEGVVFDLLEPPPSRIESNTLVDVEGVFYRTVRYENLDGKIAEAPYVLGRTLKPVDPETVEKSHTFDRTMLALIGLAVAFIVGRVVFSVSRRQRRRAGSRGSELQEALRKRQQLPSDRPR